MCLQFAQPFRRCLVLFTALFLVPCLSTGKPATAFVADRLVVLLKSEPSPPYETTGRVMTGDRLSIIETQGDAVRVRSETGDEGWMEAKYISSELPKDQVIAELKNEVTVLRNQQELLMQIPDEQAKELDLLHERLEKLGAENKRLEDTVEHLTRANEQLQTEFDTVPGQRGGTSVANSGAATLEELLRQIDGLTDDWDELNRLAITRTNLTDTPSTAVSNTSAADSSGGSSETVRNLLSGLGLNSDDEKTLYWFIAGALVFFLGMSMGLLSSRQRRRLRY